MTAANQGLTDSLGQELSANWHAGQPIRYRKSVDHTLRHGIASMLRSVARRPDFDLPDLHTLAGLRDDLDAAVAVAARTLHDSGHSWGEIGAALGTTRQNAFQTFAR